MFRRQERPHCKLWALVFQFVTTKWFFEFIQTELYIYIKSWQPEVRAFWFFPHCFLSGFLCLPLEKTAGKKQAISLKYGEIAWKCPMQFVTERAIASWNPIRFNHLGTVHFQSHLKIRVSYDLWNLMEHDEISGSVQVHRLTVMRNIEGGIAFSVEWRHRQWVKVLNTGKSEY